MADLIENFQAIQVISPVDKIIKQIRDLISSGQIGPGDRLPSERKLAEKLGVSRMHVRDAIRKLEFYGILKTLPQSGSVVSGMGTIALEGLISDVLKLEETDFGSLIETRVILEIEAAGLAAIRRDVDALHKIERTALAYEKKVKAGVTALEEDLLFHLAIAEASNNSVLKSLMLIITPDIIKSFIEYKLCNDHAMLKAAREHQQILKFIKSMDPEGAREAMEGHLEDVKLYSQNYKTDTPF